MPIDWKTIAQIVNPTSLVLLIVIFWLMKQNGQLIGETFRAQANLGRLTSLLEKLVLEKKK